MHAIILVGGFGTRLKALLPGVPKPMAPILHRPFLAYLLDYLKDQGITEVTLALHYLHEQIQAFFKDFKDLVIHYVIEEQPLGTGGAVLHALSAMKNVSQPIFVLNGDTFVKLDYVAMFEEHIKKQASMTMALRLTNDCARYGKVMTHQHHIIQFMEKGESGPGYINAGVYLINPDLFSFYVLPKQFSFENEFIVPFLSAIKPMAFMAEDYFIDIGIPDDYVRAQQELPAIFA